MSRLQSNCIIAAITVTITAGCISLFHGGFFQQADQRIVPGQTACPDGAEAAAPIEDLRTIPQNIKPFAEAIAQPMDAAMRRLAAQRFYQRYFTPWTATEPLFNVRTVTEGIAQLAAQTWYDENGLRVGPTRMQSLIALADWERFPSTNQSGIMVKPAFMRMLPTYRPFYETPDDVPFDHLQFSEIKPNEPVRILHTSKDSAWLYIETSYAGGWVDSDAVRLAGAPLQNRVMTPEQVVVVRDFAAVRTEAGTVLPQPKIGTLYPLVKKEAGYWMVAVAIAEDSRRAVLTAARIAESDARLHPVPLDSEAVTHIGNEFLKTPYGWGELYRNRDCSATTRDFFIPFGIWLPRNSYQQLTLGPFVPLAGLSAIDKENRIREQGIAFRTLLHHRGHIMLYAGLHGNKPVVLHTAWALRYKPENYAEKKYIIGGTILSTLDAGKELSLTKGTHLDRLDGMLLLPVADWQQSEADLDKSANKLQYHFK